MPPETAHPLFAANFAPVGVPYDVSRDGKKFLVDSGPESTPAPIRLVLHWDATLPK